MPFHFEIILLARQRRREKLADNISGCVGRHESYKIDLDR